MDNINADDTLKSYLLTHLNIYIVGSLLKGIIHNFNGPLQVLSMHVELSQMDVQREKKMLDALADCTLPDDVKKMVDFNLNRVEKRSAAIVAMQSAVTKLEKQVQLLTTRAWDPKEMTMPVSISKILADETLFWQGDLFFKHKVNLSIQETASFILHATESNVRDIIDAIMAICIELLRNSGSRTLTIETSSTEENHVISFRHSGLAINISRLHELDISPDLIPPETLIYIDCLARFTRIRAEELGWTLEIQPQEFICKIKIHSNK